MYKLWISLAVVCFALACTKKEAPEPSPTADTKSAAPEPAPEPAAGTGGEEKAVGDSKAVPGDGPTGIGSCDEYLDKYEKCLQAKVPEEARKAMSDAFQAQRDAWVQSAEAAKGNQEVTDQLSKNCSEAVAAAKVPMEQYGCEW